MSETTESLLQGSQLPSTVTTTQTQTVAPQFYTDYLQNVANVGEGAVRESGVAGMSPLQEQALNMAPTASFAGAESMGKASDAYGDASGYGTDAANMLTRAGDTKAYDVVQNYMNPYTQNVVDEMTRQNQLNVQRNILPALRAMGVSTGGSGSSRIANATGQTLADIQARLTGDQFNALNQGYKDAMGFAQTDLSRLLSAGTGMTSSSQNLANIGKGLTDLGTSQQNLSLTGMKNLYELGAKEQDLAQKMLDNPMKIAKDYAELMRGYQIPTGVTTQVTAPGQQGQFTNSPLAQLSGLITGLGALLSGAGNASGRGTGGQGLFDQFMTWLNTNTSGGTNPQRNGGSIRMAEGGVVDATGREVGAPTSSSGTNVNIGGLGQMAPMGTQQYAPPIAVEPTPMGGVGMFNGGPVQGGLQSIVQGVGTSMNPNIPVPSNMFNPRLNMASSKVPEMNAMSLDYQNDPNEYNLNTSSMLGRMPNTNLMVG
jgi:hypothetical protein